MKTLLVTGATAGFGAEIVERFVSSGAWRAIATGRRQDRLDALADRLGRDRVHAACFDIRDADAMAAALDAVPAPFRDLDLLVNNAGVLHSGERFGHVEQSILEDSLRTNAVGPFLLAQALAPLLADGACIANLSTVMASIASRSEFRSPSYCASKAAQNMLAVQLAHALATRGIVVLALHPGWVMTEMGGKHATVPTADAVRGLLQVVDGATPAQSGSFLDWRGGALPW